MEMMLGRILDQRLAPALRALTPSELVEVLYEVEKRCTGPGGILVRNWMKGQQAWGPNTPAYTKWKERHGMGKGLFERTGAARKALEDPTSTIRGHRLSLKTRRLSIWLKKYENDRNVYDITQRGRFQGLSETQAGGKVVEHSANEANRLNAAQQAGYGKAKAAGFKGSFGLWARGQRGGAAKSQWERKGKHGMPLMFADGADKAQAVGVLRELITDILRRRGLL